MLFIAVVSTTWYSYIFVVDFYLRFRLKFVGRLEYGVGIPTFTFLFSSNVLHFISFLQKLFETKYKSVTSCKK